MLPFELAMVAELAPVAGKPVCMGLSCMHGTYQQRACCIHMHWLQFCTACMGQRHCTTKCGLAGHSPRGDDLPSCAPQQRRPVHPALQSPGCHRTRPLAEAEGNCRGWGLPHRAVHTLHMSAGRQGYRVHATSERPILQECTCGVCRVASLPNDRDMGLGSEGSRAWLLLWRVPALVRALRKARRRVTLRRVILRRHAWRRKAVPLLLRIIPCAAPWCGEDEHQALLKGNCERQGSPTLLPVALAMLLPRHAVHQIGYEALVIGLLPCLRRSSLTRLGRASRIPRGRCSLPAGSTLSLSCTRLFGEPRVQDMTSATIRWNP